MIQHSFCFLRGFLFSVSLVCFTQSLRAQEPSTNEAMDQDLVAEISEEAAPFMESASSQRVTDRMIAQETPSKPVMPDNSKNKYNGGGGQPPLFI